MFLFVCLTSLEANEPAKIVSSVSNEEVKCLQYISGYKIHKLHNKFRFGKSFLVNSIGSVLPSCKHVKLIVTTLKPLLMLVGGKQKHPISFCAMRMYYSIKNSTVLC